MLGEVQAKERVEKIRLVFRTASELPVAGGGIFYAIIRAIIVTSARRRGVRTLGQTVDQLTGGS